jgi:FHS family Na+ dependent glucose MFS transporter 1
MNMTRAYLYFILLLLMGLSVGLMGPALPYLADQTSSTTSQIAAVFAARALGAMTGSLVGGRAFDSFNGHHMLAWALAGIAPAALLVPNTPVLSLLIGVFYLSGFFEGGVNVGTNTLLVRCFGVRVHPYMNALHFSYGIGATIAPFLLSLAVITFATIRPAFYVVSLFAGFLVIPLLRLPAPKAEPTSRGAVRPRRYHAFLVLLFALTFMLYVGSEATVGGWIFTFALEESAVSPAKAAVLTSLFWGGLTLGRLLGVVLVRHFMPRHLVPIQMVAGLFCLIVIALASHSFWGLATATLLFGLSIASVFPMTMTLASQSLSLTGKVTGAFFVGGACGGMTMPWLTGQLFDSSGPYSVQVVAGCSLLAALVLILVAIGKDDRANARTTRLIHHP